MIEWKVTVDSVDYTNDVFTEIMIVCRENDVSSVILSAANTNSLFYPSRGESLVPVRFPP